MLKHLYISNYALIDQLDIDFECGLTIITGETGAGKSIILGALSLIMGERADTDTVRDKSKKTTVEATFDVWNYDLKAFFEDNDLDYNDECIVRREIVSGGRSRTFVNDTPVALGTLKELATHLIDIHSQHSNMLLSKSSFQLSVLDALAQNKNNLINYQKVFTLYKNLEKQHGEAVETYEKSRAEEDYIRFQLGQFEELKLHAGEDEELETLQNRLENATANKEALWSVSNILESDDVSLIEQLKDVASNISRAEESIEELSGVAERVKSLVVELKDIARTVNAVEDSLNDDPQALQQVNDRLSEIYSLERKHNVDSVDALLDIESNFSDKLQEIDSSEDKIEHLKKQCEDAKKEATRLALILRAERKKRAEEFVSQIKPLAKSLGMKNLEFAVDFEEVGLNLSGCDNVEYKFAFNKNQQLMPVKSTASGGEISRLMLCMKSVIARTMNLPTIIFDEVDTGVSGDVANRIGELMRDMSQNLQVIAITHLPQVAAHGSSQMRVYKSDTQTDTLTRIEHLDYDQRVVEIAKMMSGKDVNEAAINNAKALLESSGV